MIYLLSTGVALLVIVAAGTAGLLYLATRDVASTEDDDEDDDLGDLIDSLPIYVSPVPPFEVICLGPKGQHDEYPIGPELRGSYVDFLEASWSLPCAGRCPVCWSPVDGNQCHLHESDVQ